jgi:hypothetical protein
VSSPYKLRRKGEKLPGGHEKLAEELGTLEVFKPSKVAGELHRFLQGVQKAFENNLSLERGFVLSVKRSRGLVKSRRWRNHPSSKKG